LVPKPPPTSGACSGCARRQLEHELGELAADAVQALPGQLEVEASRSRDRSARCRRVLDRRHHDAIVHHVDLDDVRRLLHRRADRRGIALLEWNAVLRGACARVRRALGERGAPSTTAAATRSRRRQLGGLAGDLGAVGHDEGHRIADMAHAVDRQRGARRHDQRRHRRQAGHRPSPARSARV
jgi:hypothetical protein